MDNYEISRDRAQQYFLNFDQQKMIAQWNLQHDAQFLYVTFINRPYRICRATGAVQRCWDGSAAGFEETLSIFDFLCHESEVKLLTGNWAPVNSLNGLTCTAGVGTDFHVKLSRHFDADPEGFQAACRQLGGEHVDLGDIGFRIPIFGDFGTVVKFYYSDDEFPAATTLLWDENALQFLFYETVFYVAGFLLKSIACIMDTQK